LLVLSNLLPGIRDLRIPLITGYFWVVVLWLYGRDLPTNLATSIPRFGETFGAVSDGGSQVILGFALSTVAYLLGIVSVAFLSPVVKAAMGVVGFCVAAPVRVVGDLPRSRWPWLSGRCRALADLLSSPTDKPGPPGQEMYGLALRLIGEAFISSQETRAQFLERLDHRAIDRLLTRLMDEEVHHLFTRGREEYSPARIRKELARDPGDRLGLRKHLVHAVTFDAVRKLAVRRALIKALVNVDEHAADLLHENRTAPARLIIANPGAYDRWDRLVAESEFRSAVAVPIVALAFYNLNTLALAGLLLAAFGLSIDAVRKMREADLQLNLYLETRLVAPANLGAPGAAQFYWLDWDPKAAEAKAAVPPA